MAPSAAKVCNSTLKPVTATGYSTKVSKGEDDLPRKETGGGGAGQIEFVTNPLAFLSLTFCSF